MWRKLVCPDEFEQLNDCLKGDKLRNLQNKLNTNYFLSSDDLNNISDYEVNNKQIIINLHKMYISNSDLYKKLIGQDELEQLKSLLKKNKDDLEKIKRFLEENKDDLERVKRLLKNGKDELNQLESSLKENELNKLQDLLNRLNTNYFLSSDDLKSISDYVLDKETIKDLHKTHILKSKLILLLNPVTLTKLIEVNNQNNEFAFRFYFIALPELVKSGKICIDSVIPFWEMAKCNDCTYIGQNKKLDKKKNKTNLQLASLMLNFANNALKFLTCKEIWLRYEGYGYKADYVFKFAIAMYTCDLKYSTVYKLNFDDQESIIDAITTLKKFTDNEKEYVEKAEYNYFTNFGEIAKYTCKLMLKIKDPSKRKEAIFKCLELFPDNAINYLAKEVGITDKKIKNVYYINKERTENEQADFSFENGTNIESCSFLRDNLLEEPIKTRLKHLSDKNIIKGLCTDPDKNKLDLTANEYYLKLIKFGPNEIINYMDFSFLRNNLDDYLIKGKLRFVKSSRTLQTMYNAIKENNLNKTLSEQKQSMLDFLNLRPKLVQVFSDNNDFELLIDQIKNKNIKVLKLFRNTVNNVELSPCALSRLGSYILNMQNQDDRKKIINILMYYMCRVDFRMLFGTKNDLLAFYEREKYADAESVFELNLFDFGKRLLWGKKYLCNQYETYSFDLKVFFGRLALATLEISIALLVIYLYFCIAADTFIFIALCINLGVFWMYPLSDILLFGYADSLLKKILCRGFDVKKDINDNCKNKCTSAVDKICEDNANNIVLCSLDSFKDDRKGSEIINDMKKFFGFENLKDMTDDQIKLYIEYENNIMFSNLNDWIKTFVDNLDAIIVGIKNSVSAELFPKESESNYDMIGTYRDVIDEYFNDTDKLKDTIEIKLKMEVQRFISDDSSYSKTLFKLIKELIDSKQNQPQEKDIPISNQIESENENEFEIDTSSK